LRLHVSEDFLQLEYTKELKNYDEERYFEEEGNEAFDAHSLKQMQIMMTRIGEAMSLDDYSLKKLEVFLRTELPFFAVTRRLVFQWVTKNFLY